MLAITAACTASCADGVSELAIPLVEERPVLCLLVLWIFLGSFRKLYEYARHFHSICVDVPCFSVCRCNHLLRIFDATGKREDGNDTIKELKWETLENKRRKTRITSLYRAHLGQKAWIDITARLEKPTYYGRNDHDFKIKCRKQKTDVGINLRKIRSGTGNQTRDLSALRAECSFQLSYAGTRSTVPLYRCDSVPRASSVETGCTTGRIYPYLDKINNLYIIGFTKLLSVVVPFFDRVQVSLFKAQLVIVLYNHLFLCLPTFETALSGRQNIYKITNHSSRCTAVSNMTRIGIQEQELIKITDHTYASSEIRFTNK
ncbi:hypothetical protein ANN_02026 [Periplaneta americana]|uniref:Uncharacterized protein n=1 Tax=Periplaneta americana TaxID=6978 RepID=A0ABQ8TZB9_PERAM|nr:hypothetical protein ANN_02026 [Periplaneta americana]